MLRVWVHKILGNEMWSLLRRLFKVDQRNDKRMSEYDFMRMLRYSCSYKPKTREALLADVIMAYHVIEKGLTMPDRRIGFGKEAALRLVQAIESFSEKHGCDDMQLQHAVAVLKEYYKVHEEAKFVFEEQLKRAIENVISKYPTVKPSTQSHFTKEAFYANVESSFPSFARSRHTIRRYSDEELSSERVKQAVELALTTPSACNRQYWRVYCVEDRNLAHRILDFQRGNRGFGHLATRVVVVAVNIEALGMRERNDAYTNGGMFLMNLCYAFFYLKIAYCILNWSRSAEDDMQLRSLLGIPESDSVIAILSCGETPEEFDVALSPRRPVGDIFKVI